jgi:AraC-like DNA-binding protein
MKWLQWLHYLPFVLCCLYFLFAFHFHSVAEKRQLIHTQEVFGFAIRKNYGAAIALQVFIYNLLSVYAIESYARRYAHRSGLVLNRIRWGRFVIYGYFFVCILNNIASFFFPLANTGTFTTYFYLSGLMFLVYFTVILTGALLGSHFGSRAKSKKAVHLSDEEVQKLQAKLAPYLEREKSYLEFNLTLSELASRIGFRERQLSEFINTYCYTTFQDYINSFRIEEAKQLIKKSASSGQTILEIAYASGFNSKSAFNAAFKKHTRSTPSAYKKLAGKRGAK